MNELTLQLVASGQKHLYEQIYEYIKNEIKAGKLLRNEKLPSTRVLANHLQVSRSTVDLAYEQLLSEGYIEAKAYKGYYVCKIEDLYDLRTNVKEVPIMPHEVYKYQYDFSANGIDMDGFPLATWKTIYKNTLMKYGNDLFNLGESKGEAELCVTIGRYLHSSRGVNCRPEQIIIGAGNDYLLLLLEKILGTNRKMAIEDPTYKRAYLTFEACHYEMIRIAMDESGMRADELKKSRADIAYVMPAHQYPTGIIMPIGRRTELLNWTIEADNRYLIEDDYDSEFRYKGKPIPSLQATDRNDKVIYIGTFSKSIAPAIRVSYMVLPLTLLEEYEKKAFFFASTVSRTDQAMLEEFIRDGYYERHLNKMRKTYKGKHDLLLGSLRGFEKQFSVSGENAGLHILLNDKAGRSEAELVRKAKEAGVRVYGISETYIRRSEQEEEAAIILLGYGGLTEVQITEGIQKLKEVWL